MVEVKHEMLAPNEVSARSGVAISALHFYERNGLITAQRTAGNQRRYRRDVLRRLAFIRMSQRVGIPIRDIRTALNALPAGKIPTKRDWQRLMSTWRADLDDRITTLLELREQFTSCIGCGCMSLKACALYNSADELAAEGAGPRRLHSPE